MGAQVVSPPRRSIVTARAGLHSRDLCGSHFHLRVWIPASAGMTEGFV
jgi:hypothetical protein